MDYSPFIKPNENENKNNIREILYENPSMGAVTNWMCYILICYYIFDNEFKNAESSQILTFIIFLSILILWYEFIYSSWLSILHWLKQSPTTYEITKGNNAAYTMTGEEPNNPFSNIIGSIVADFALLEKSLEFNNLDYKFKDKIRAKYICFYDDQILQAPGMKHQKKWNQNRILLLKLKIKSIWNFGIFVK
ncbi:hypothetical protein F8M41_012199 [Gigaspora margarita]|uniref:Uncharacterized protein n=1 Tax=Gigaspora margarita TaxID=4874 RepID=A0A8H4EPN4_GIGMA|nr:hypothetical protein F8M41_012199 [Gigaspora margarita]